MQTINEDLQQINGTLNQEITSLKQKQDQLKNLCDEIILVEYPNNPLEIEPSNLPKSLVKKSSKELKKHKNSIDNLPGYALNLSRELNIPINLIESDLDASTHTLKQVHAKNTEIARIFIDKYAPKKSYNVVTKLTPEIINDNTVVHRIYVKNSSSSIKTLHNLLEQYRPDRVSSKHKLYTCDKQKIIDIMNAVAISD